MYVALKLEKYLKRQAFHESMILLFMVNSLYVVMVRKNIVP